MINEVEWPPTTGAVLSLRRLIYTGDRWHWNVSSDAGGLTVIRYRRDQDNLWQAEDPRTGFKDLADVLASDTELSTLRRGTISRYNLSPSAMEPALFVSLLRVSPEGGAEVPADWPEKIAREWADDDSYLADWTIEGWFHRWAQVNDIRITAVNTTGDGDAILAAVLIDGYEEDLHTYRDIAWSEWFSESGGAPISWNGGYKLSMLSPELGYIKTQGDQELGSINPFIRIPAEPAKLAEVIAKLVTETDSEVAAALALEPLDPNGELEKEAKEEWNARLTDVSISFGLDAADEVQQAVRADLNQRSERYRRVRDGLARPTSHEGQALAAALDDALADGVIGNLASGYWDE